MGISSESRKVLVLYRPLRDVLVLVLNCGNFTLQLGVPNANFATSGNAGGRMSDFSDRREARRFAMNLPVRVLLNDANGPELKANTRDVSYRGLYFVVEATFEKGNEIDFILRLPQQCISAGDVNILCHATVVRVECNSHDKPLMAAQIAKY